MEKIHKKKSENRHKIISIVKADIPDEKHLLFTAFIVVLTSLVVVNTIFWLDRNPNTGVKLFRYNSNQNNYSNKILTSQQQGVTPVAQVTISEVTEQTKFDPAFTIAKDETVLLMDITIINNGSGQQDVIPVNQLFVRDREGGYYPMHASSLVTNSLAATTLEPGQRASGQISFVVPKSLANPLLYVDLGWNGYGPIVFDVLR